MLKRRALVAPLVLAALTARAEVPTESLGRSETLPDPPRPHWVWISDPMLRRAVLVDLDDGRFLGMVSSGFLSQAAAFPQTRREFYVPETHYSRGSRGVRTDVVTFYDTGTLGPVAEVVIPPKRAVNVLPTANSGLSDDDRFLGVFNMNPATSISIVDVVERRFVGEISTPGCSLVYPAGPRRFAMLCSDGALLSVQVDGRGRELEKTRSEPFFDPSEDPVIEKAVRWNDSWIFVSFEGIVHAVDVAGELLRFAETWSLLDECDRRESWRVGGLQPFALHEPSGRLFALMHRGGAHSHKEPGIEAWVYDLAARERIQRIPLRHPGLAFVSETIEFGRSWISPFDRLWDWMLDALVPHPGIYQVQVTRDAAPLLVTGSQIGGSLAVYDALSGDFLRRVTSGNLTTHGLQAPWLGAEAAP
jgi:methylamine dehydrogenase heavy chain